MYSIVMLNNCGTFCIALLILENVFMAFVVIWSILYFVRYRRQDKLIKEILKSDGVKNEIK